MDKSAVNVIAMARVSGQALKNPEKAGIISLNEVAGKISQAMDSDGDKVAESMFTQTVKNSKLALDLIANPTSGSVKIFKM